MEFGLAPMPKGTVQAVCLGGYNLAINSNTANPDLAWAFVEYLTSRNATMCSPSRDVSPEERMWIMRPFWEINPEYQVFIDEAEYTVPRPRVKNAKSVDDKMVDAFTKVYFDQMTAEQALNELERSSTTSSMRIIK